MFPQILIQSLLNHCESLIIGRKKLLFTLRLKIFEGKGYSALIGRMIWNLFKLVGEICLLVNLRKLRKKKDNFHVGIIRFHSIQGIQEFLMGILLEILERGYTRISF